MRCISCLSPCLPTPLPACPPAHRQAEAQQQRLLNLAREHLDPNREELAEEEIAEDLPGEHRPGRDGPPSTHTLPSSPPVPNPRAYVGHAEKPCTPPRCLLGKWPPSLVLAWRELVELGRDWMGCDGRRRETAYVNFPALSCVCSWRWQRRCPELQAAGGAQRQVRNHFGRSLRSRVCLSAPREIVECG